MMKRGGDDAGVWSSEFLRIDSTLLQRHAPVSNARSAAASTRCAEFEQMATTLGCLFVGADKNGSPDCHASCHFRQDRPPNRANGPQLGKVKTCASASRF